MTWRWAMALLLVALPVMFFGAMLLLASVTRASKPIAVRGEQVAAINGGSVRYQMAGEGTEVVLFLHGFNGRLSMWDGVWTRLEQCPVRRLRVDVPGFGASRIETDDYGLDVQAGRLIEVLDALHIEKVTVVGASMGGSLAVWLAAQHPERVERLVLLAPSGYPGSLHHPGLFGQLIQPGAIRDGATLLARTSLYKAIFPRSVALQAATVTTTYGQPWLEQLRTVRAPTLLAWARGDATARSETAQLVLEALPNGALFWLEGAGHGIAASHPAFVAEASCLMSQGADPSDVVRSLSAQWGAGN